MFVRQAVPLVVALVVGLPGALPGEVAIDHEPVACLVAGKYPRIDACLTPPSQVARARVYFKPEDSVGWYYVVMKPEALCFAGVLPKPTRRLVGKRFLYYLDAADRRFNESRTPDHAVDIVADPLGCKKGMPVAPTVANASVTVFPGMPAGMVAGGLGTGATVAIAAGTTAAVGGGVAIANSIGAARPAPPDPDPPPPPPPAPEVPPPPPEVPPPPVIPPTTTENGPPVADFRVSPDPPEGPSPLTVTFNTCRSTDPDGNELVFTFDFGDGATFRGNCRATHTYVNPPGPASALATVCVTDGRPQHERCQSYTVKPRAPNPCVGDRQPPAVSLGPIAKNPEPPISVSATVTDDVGVEVVEFFAEPEEGKTEALGSLRQAPYAVAWTPKETCSDYEVVARALDVCGKTAEAKVIVNVRYGCDFAVASTALTLGLTSDLRIAGGHGQVGLNGRPAMSSGPGPARASLSVGDGFNLVEALLTDGKGEAGTWRFELAGNLEPGSLRVEAGEVVLVTDTTVVFRMGGRKGERVVFRFRAVPSRK